ncbi:tubulin-folding cofactor B-like isoform X2 [Harpegnathos saltator]|uniref:tubulin-folding cofactor B-like isoform X2 n=1 Tax=Harpegnathos saltator TaxID=610380 RepID=UPI000DBED21F|nr:tubulin-folding cofactor B-like isoform X2 [Harpegnathos saltator]
MFYIVDTVKAFLEKNKVGKYNEEDMRKRVETKKKEEKKREEVEEHLISLCKIGDRCEVSVPNQRNRRPTVLYTLHCKSAAGVARVDSDKKTRGVQRIKDDWWTGLKYNETLGKNDGSIGSEYQNIAYIVAYVIAF